MVDRIAFLAVLDDVLYARPEIKVSERGHLQKMLERNAWIFGEQWQLATADRSVSNIVRSEMERQGWDPDADSEAQIDHVSSELRLIPDFYLVQSRQERGMIDHLIVEIKAPGVRITDGHIGKLHRYADAIVEQPVFGEGHHRFTFVLLSSDVVESVERMRMRQAREPYGLISRPQLRHETSLHAYRWSKILDERRADLEYLQKQIEVREDPDAIGYLRSRFPDLFEWVGPP